MAEKNEQTYVSFKWMLAQTLALIISVVTIGFLIVSSIGSKVDIGLASKVSIVQFEERTKSLSQADSETCRLIDQYTKEKAITNDRLALIEQHLAILVGKPLKLKEKQ
jgi:hypothetical protein